ncbi:MAG: rRNA adenine N-6-methyltransferase family protein [Patescibacteria group bacterium]
MNKEQLIKLLERFDITPDSNFKDQHFMVNPEVIEDVMIAAGVLQQDHILEIGPGPGQLTEAILAKGAQLTVIEIDTRFEGIMTELQEKYPGKLTVIWGSALDVEWPRDINKLVMNPPYSILEPLLQLIYAYEGLEIVSMIIGRRYYENCSSRIGDNSFNKTSLMTQAKFDVHFVKNIDKESFYPKEGERSVVMYLTAKERPEPALYKIAEFFVESPAIDLKFVLVQVLEGINRKAGKHKHSDFANIVTIKGLGINPKLLNRRLQDLNNHDIAHVVSKLSFCFNKKKSKQQR